MHEYMYLLGADHRLVLNCPIVNCLVYSHAHMYSKYMYGVHMNTHTANDTTKAFVLSVAGLCYKLLYSNIIQILSWQPFWAVLWAT